MCDKFIEPPSLFPPALDCLPPAKLLARPRELRAAIPARATPLRNSLLRMCLLSYAAIKSS
jgi:hypothetical protein